MNHIFYIMGKSASGKDRIYRELLRDFEGRLEKIVLYTTRPMREGEKDGREYFFVDEERFCRFREEKKLLEARAYTSVHGVWRYFTADDGQIDLDRSSYLAIGTLESYIQMKQYYPEGVLCPVYVEVEDGERLTRALEREKKEAFPRYAELCRRFLADCEDFSEEKIREAEIERRFENVNFQICLAEIENYMRSVLY